MSDAVQLSKNIGNPYDIVPIKDIYASFLTALKPIYGDLPFSLAEENLQSRIRAVILMGQDAPLIEAALQTAGVDLHHAVDMTEAVRRAARCAVAGDAVLLSPACASLDMFKNYVHRAQVFVQAVQELGEEAGTP